MRNGIRSTSALRPDSVLLFQPADGSAEKQADFVQCVHCGRHWPVGGSIAGIASGKLALGFCARCNGITCGAKCQKCVPIEQQLENVEAGRPKLIYPIRV